MLYVTTYSISLQVIFYSFTKEDGMVLVLAQNRKDQCYKADLFRKKDPFKNSQLTCEKV